MTNDQAEMTEAGNLQIRIGHLDLDIGHYSRLSVSSVLPW